MATLIDGQVGIKKETTYGTPVTVDRFYEVLPDSTHDFDPMRIEGEGLKVGATHKRADRAVAGVGKGELTIKVELISKSLGVLLEAICGSAAITNVSGATYQILGKADFTTATRNSYTIQVGVPQSDASGTVSAFTYAGCVATGFEIDAPDGGVPTLSVTFWSASLATATALAAASYASSATMFASGSGNAATTLGGTITAPTTTALESGGTSSTNIRGWTLTGDLTANERPRLGGWQRPTAGGVSTTLKIVQDYDATTVRDLVISQASTSFTGYYTGAALSAGTERFGVVVPAMKVQPGAFGQLTNGEGSTPEPTFDVFDNGTDEPWYIVARTADTAL